MPYQSAADGDRVALLGTSGDPARYAAFLSRIFGFEAPVESALAMTPQLGEWIDLRERARVKLLRADLQALGIVDASALPRCTTVAPFRHVADALGWIYVVERNTLMHAVVERQLRVRMPDTMKSAGSYLAGQQRSNGERLRELGAAMDRLARDAGLADRIGHAAKFAFRVQRGWYEVAVPRRPRQWAS